VEQQMLDFEEELKKFTPSHEVEDAEDAIYSRDLTDMTDILQEMMKEAKRNSNQLR
jgi:hypothetical protein